MIKKKQIIGLAQNRKNGIVIAGEEDYFVKNEACWEEKYFGKEVRAEGDITITQKNSLLPPIDDGILAQGIPTHSWDEFKALNKQYWIEIETIEIVKP